MAYKTQQTKGQSERQSGRVGRWWRKGGPLLPLWHTQMLSGKWHLPSTSLPFGASRLDFAWSHLSLSLCVCHHQHRHQRRRLLRWQPWRDRRSKGEWSGERGEAKGAVDNHTKCCHLPFVRFCHLPYRRIFIWECVSVSCCLSFPLFLSLALTVCVCGRARVVGKQIVKSSPESTSKLCVNTH